MQPLDIGVSAISAGTTQAFGGQVVFSDSHNISFGVNGHTVTASVAPGAFTGVSGIGVSTGGNTSGTTGTVVGTVVLAGINNITLSQATSPGPMATITISGANAIFGAGVSTGGNTSGTTGTVTGTLVLAGLGEITLSQSTNASGATITISAGTDTAASAVSAIGVSTGGNTSGNTGTTQGTVVLAGIGNITLSQSTAAGSLATITISGSQSTSPAAIAAGTQTATSGTVVFSNSNNVSFGMSNSSVVTASFSQSVQPGVTAIGVSTDGNTSGNTGTTQGTYVLAGGNQITLSQVTAAGSLATVTISGRDAIFGAGVSSGGNGTGTTGTVTGTLVFAGGSNITLSQSTNASGATITIDAATASAAATVVSAIGVSTGGNTSGNTGTTNGTVVFAGINHITLSQATAPGSLATITISGDNAVFGAGVSTGGNTSGTTGTNTGTFVLAGGNNITLSQATGAGGNTVTISGPPSLAISAGTQSASSGTVVFSNSNNVTFGMSNSSVVTASIGNVATTVSAFSHNAEWVSNWVIQQGILSLQRVTVPLNITFNSALFAMNLSAPTASSGGMTLSLGIYTFTGSTASLSTSFSGSTTWTSGTATSASSDYGGVSGTRYRAIPSAFLLPPGDYLVGVHVLTTNAGTWSIFGHQRMSIVGQLSLPVNVTNNFIDGVSLSSFSTALPTGVIVTDTNYNRTGSAALRQPGFIVLTAV